MFNSSLLTAMKSAAQKLNTPFRREVGVILVISIIAFWFAQHYDFFEELVEVSRDYEHYELDELFILLKIAGIGLIVIIYRHSLYLKQEIMRREEAETKILKMAFYDSLTGLANRNLCHDRLEHILAHSERQQTQSAVLFIDLDNFKEINDNQGHTYGDEVLKQVSTRMNGILRSEDTLSRFAGDEFVILLDSVKSITDISILAKRLLAQAALPYTINGKDMTISLSIGIALFPTDSTDPDELINQADTAMYHAKSEGKNTYRFFSKALDEEAKRTILIRSHLRKALEKKEFSLVYQPIIDSKNKQLKGAEALIRWNNPILGEVSPVVFIPIAEETGLIAEIGRWVLDKACQQNKQWQLSGYQPIVMSVNMSARQLQNDTVVQDVEYYLQTHKLAPKYLELELTETTAMQDIDSAIKRLKQLKQLGITLALDDFGTGYSSMSYLRKLKPNRLKIDRSFIKNTPDNVEDTITTEAIIALANNLKLKITAEGVETAEQLKFIEATLCDSVQGFYFSKPLTPHDFFEYLASTQAALINSDSTPIKPVGNNLTTGQQEA